MPANIDYFCSDSVRQDLKGKTVRGGLFTALAQTGATVFQLASIPILARLLTKDDFGLIAMVTFFTGFAAMFVDAGMSMATVQRGKITHGQVSNLFWIATLLGLLLALVMAATSPLIAWFYGDPRLLPVAVAMGLSFLFAGLTVQHRALLTRTMQFKRLACITLVSAFLSQVVAIYLAWQYRSYWALAARPIAAAAAAMALTWLLTGWLPGLPRRATGVRSMVGFGANLTGVTTINYFSRNADNLFIGKFWGEGELGLYAQAYKLFLMPMRKVNGPLGAVAAPALSRLVEQPARYRQYYLSMVGKLALVTMPFAVFLSVAADLVIPTVLGPGWEGSAPVLRALALAGIPQAVSTTAGWLYVSQGRSSDMLRWNMRIAPVVMLSFVAGLPWGAVGVATSYACVVLFVATPLQIRTVCSKGPVRVRHLLSTTPLPAVAACAVAIGVVLSKLLLSGPVVEINCLLAAVCGGLLAIAVLAALPAGRAAFREMLDLLKLIKPSRAAHTEEGSY